MTIWMNNLAKRLNRVATPRRLRLRLPWVCNVVDVPNLKGLRQRSGSAGSETAPQPFQGWNSLAGPPRVARCSQPWAGGLNPFGIEPSCKVQRAAKRSKHLAWLAVAALLALLSASPLGLRAEHLPNAAAHIGSILINSGTQFTTNLSVNLTLSAVNDGTGVSQMQFSNDNAAWSTPEAYQTAKLWQLTNDGVFPPQMNTVLKTVYVRFRDGAGNWSKAVSDSIVFGRSALDIPRITELWIAQQRPINYDGTQPLGTQRNPSLIPPPPNEPQFDSLMYSLMTNYAGYQARADSPTNPPPPATNMTVLTLHIAPGVYETHGDNNVLRDTSAWNPQQGWRIIGAGKDLTTLKQVEVRSGWWARSSVVGSPVGQSACYDNFQLRDLTVDANILEGETNILGRFAYGINFVGNNVQVRRVRVKNFGSYVRGAEPGGIRMQNFGSAGGTYNVIVEDCDVVQPQVGGLYKAPMLEVAGEFGTTTNMNYYYNVVVRNCYVNGAVYDRDTALDPTPNPSNERGTHGLSIGGTWGAIVEDNLVLNCVEGYYVDEGTVHDLLVQNNHFRGVQFGAVVGYGTGANGQVRRVEDVFRLENNLIELDPHLYSAGELNGAVRYGFLLNGDLKGPDDYIFNHLIISNNVVQFNDRLKPDANLLGIPGFLQAFRYAEVRDNVFWGFPPVQPLKWDNAPAYLGLQVDILNPTRSVPLVCSNNLREDGAVLEAYPYVLDSTLPRPVVVAGEEINFPAPTLAGGGARVVIGLPSAYIIDQLGNFRWKTSVQDVGQYIASFYDSTNRIHDPRRTLITVVARTPLVDAQYFANGLVAFWKFEETSGTMLYDSSGNDNEINAYSAVTASLLNLAAPGCAPGKKALQFVGGSTPIPAPYNFQVLNGFPELYHPLRGGPANAYQSFSLSFWFNVPAKPSAPQLLLNQSASVVCSLLPGTNAAPNTFAVSVTSFDQQMSLMTPSTVTVGNWHHGVITYDKFASKLYLDGLLAAQEDSSPLLVTGQSIFSIGGGLNLANFAGRLAEVAIWNRSLSDQEIARLYNDQALGVDPSVAPLPPAVLLAQSVGGSSVALTWQDNSMNESGFLLERGTDGTTFTAIASLPRNAASYTDTLPQAGPAYYYRLEATNSFGSSASSNVAMVGQRQPVAPTGLRLIGTSVVTSP